MKYDSLLREAYFGLTGKELEYETSIKFSGRFKDYRYNASRRGNIIQFNLSKTWRPVNKEIFIGLLQHLFVRLFKIKKSTTNIDLYNLYIKNLHKVVRVDKSDPVLIESFNRINQKYFYSFFDTPNLEWGQNSVRTLGRYDIRTDTITISKGLDQNQDLLDYVMYHELLHKKHQFNAKNGRNYYHNTKFKNEEKQFENYKQMEAGLKKLSASNSSFTRKRNSFLSRFFE